MDVRLSLVYCQFVLSILYCYLTLFGIHRAGTVVSTSAAHLNLTSFNKSCLWFHESQLKIAYRLDG